jgi:hypothetical protein
MKARAEVDAGADARMKRLYDARDTMIEEIERAIADEEGYDLTDRLQREQLRWPQKRPSSVLVPAGREGYRPGLATEAALPLPAVILRNRHA